MRVLRLSTSDDILPTVGEHERGYRLIEQALAAETGEPVEMIVREVWPDAGLPAAIDRWLERWDPDLVSFKVSSFPFTYESVPVRLKALPFIGPALTRLGLKAAASSAVGNSLAFEAGRRFARRALGSATYISPDQMIAVCDQAIRRIVQHERAVVVVRGPLVAEIGGCSARLQARGEARRRRVDRAMAAVCAELHVHYTGRAKAPAFSEVKKWRGPDRLHLTAAGHQRMGREEAAATVAAWRHAHGAGVPLYLESEAVT